MEFCQSEKVGTLYNIATVQLFIVELVRGIMENSEFLCGEMVKLSVPLKVSLKAGKSWGGMDNVW